MKRKLLLIISAIFLVNCSQKDDGGIDCSLFDPVFPSLYLKIIDANGVNLFENGTFNPEDVSTKGNFSNAGFNFISINEDNRSLDNSLLLSIPNQLASTYTIQLNSTNTIAIDFKTEEVKLPCSISYYKPTEAQLLTKKLELKEFDTLQYCIIIEL
jgi:phosphatidate phosphatase PAH1